MVRVGLDECRRGGYSVVVVVGPVPAEVFMVLELEAGALAGRSGVVRYQPEFSAFD